MLWQQRQWLNPVTAASVTITMSSMCQALWFCRLIQVSQHPGEVHGQEEAKLGLEPWWSGLGTHTLDHLVHQLFTQCGSLDSCGANWPDSGDFCEKEGPSA